MLKRVHPLASVTALFFIIASIIAPPAHSEGTPDAFTQAFPTVFALRSGTQAIELNTQCTSRVSALMTRNSIPVDISTLRNMSDAALMRLGILAAVANISPWLRDASGNGLIMLEQDGKLTREHGTASMESNIMLCIVCTLLAVIGAIHIASMRAVA